MGQVWQEEGHHKDSMDRIWPNGCFECESAQIEVRLLHATRPHTRIDLLHCAASLRVADSVLTTDSRSKRLRGGLYAHVSTNDQQTLAMQNRAMREYAVRRGWTIAMQAAR